jgi:methylated-DNA-[protein]-cysteine S-methyltransferase
MVRYTLIGSPIDDLLIVADGDAIVSLQMATHRGESRHLEPAWRRDDHDPLLTRAAAQLDEYFGRRRIAFDLPLRPAGTDFQKRVWEALLDIPFGQTHSYGEIATRLGDANASRAVGLANGRNPIAILIPCHRVIGADGSMTGFGGGIERKRFLLELEGAIRTVETLFDIGASR